MNTHADNIQENKSQTVANNLPKEQSNGESSFQFVDNRPEAIAQRKLQEAINNSPQVKQLRAIQAMADSYASQTAQRKENLEGETLQGKFETIQKKENNTGLPDNLKSGVENLSGYSLDDVKVHYNSDKPAQLQAHAYAQGSDIHLASGQEKHLPHEAWHVVQQKQGRVIPTMQMKGKVNINDDVRLEKEADMMGAKALSASTLITPTKTIAYEPATQTVVQNYFTCDGYKMHKVRQWVSITKKKLEENGEKLLLEFFNAKAKSKDNEVKWGNIGESYAETRLALRKMLDDETDAPLTLMDYEMPTEKLEGAKSTIGYNRLAAWDISDRGVLDPRTHTELAHVSKKDDWMKERINTNYGAEKGELGQGFYTVSGHSDVGAEGIRDEFGETNKEPRDVLKFRIANVEIIKMVNGDEDLGKFLIYVLQHPSGYPPKVNPMDSINAINKMGIALIFPDKTTEVDTDNEGTKHSYETFREANGPGSHSLIIGPQARPSLDGIRQICARGYLGDKILNEAPRSEKRLGPRPKIKK